MSEITDPQHSEASPQSADLLAAAQRLQGFVDRVWSDGWDLRDAALLELDSILEDFPSAIAKAEGRQS